MIRIVFAIGSLGLLLGHARPLMAAAPPATSPAAGGDDSDMELTGLGPWARYGTPTTLEKSPAARTGQRCLHVVTDNRNAMGGGFEGACRSLGRHDAGDVLTVSVWFNIKAGGQIIVAIGQTSFLSHAVLNGSGWTRGSVSLRCPKTGDYNLWISQVSAPADFLLDDLTMEVAPRPRLGLSDKADRVSLTGGPLRLTVCRKTGTLAGIENLATGEAYSAVGARLPLVGLELLNKDGDGFDHVPFERLRLLDVEAQPPKRARLKFAVADLAIELDVTVELKDDGSAQFRGEIRNHSDRRITSCEMPILQSVRPAGPADCLTLVQPDQGGQIEKDATRAQGCQTTWPGQGVMGWMDLSGEKSGLYLATGDSSLTPTRLNASPAPDDGMDLSLGREVVVPPKTTAPIPPAELAVHVGDWHASADRYRAWVESWQPAPSPPVWIGQANGWVLVGLQNDIPFRQLSDFYRQAQWMGIEYLHVQGQGIDSMSRGKDDKFHGQTQMYVYPSPRLGGPEELKAAIRKIHDAGGRVMFYSLYDRWRPALSSADDMGTGRRSDIPRELQPPPVEFYYENGLTSAPDGKLPTEHPYEAERLMCLGSRGWQDWQAGWAKLYATEYGADGFYWDVMGRNGPFRCFNERHGHSGENTWPAGCRDLLARTLRDGRKVNPDYACAIEGCSDVLGENVGFHLMSGATMTPNVFRYTFPSYLCVDGFSNHTWKMTQPQKARRVFLDGERFDIHGYHQEVKRVIDLRRRIRPFIDWPAVFKDTVGLTVSNPAVEARAFWRTDGGNKAIAITILNENAVEGATVKVDLSPLAGAKPVAVHLFGLNGRVEKIAPSDQPTQTIPVPKDQVSVAVIVAVVSPELAAIPWIEQIMEPGRDGAVLSIFQPVGPVENLIWKVNWPKGFNPEEKALPAGSPFLRQVAFYDAARLTGLTQWQKVTARIAWSKNPASHAEAWTMLCPALVNGGFENVDGDGRLDYWAAKPCDESPGQGRRCVRMDRVSAPGGMLISITPLKPNCKYRFKAMIRRTGTQWAGAHVIEYEEGAAFRRSAALNSTQRGEWETLETTFVSHPNPRSSAIYLYNMDPENPACYDGLKLEEVR